MKLKKVEKMQTNTFLINEENSQQRIDIYLTEPVSYTHLTLPTILRV